jgi:hypothetical protein
MNPFDETRFARRETRHPLLRAKALFKPLATLQSVREMSDETKYRTEPPEQDESEKTGLLRPLPTAPTSVRPAKVHPIVNFLGISMRENRRDLLVLFLVPLLAAIIDANVYAAVVIGILDDSVVYIFGIPALTAIPIGLTSSQASRALIGAILAALFLAIIFLMFLMSPALLSFQQDIGSYFVSGMLLVIIYSILSVFASLLGSFIGILIREFL